MENKNKESRPGIIPGVNEINSGPTQAKESTDRTSEESRSTEQKNETAPSTEMVNNTGADVGTPTGDADAASG